MPWNKPYFLPDNQLLAPELYACANLVYFVTIRAYKHQIPFVRQDLNKMTLDTLIEEGERQSCNIFIYCLMPDHLHFLAGPKTDGISILRFTDQYKGKSTNSSWTAGWTGKLWQPRYYKHIIRAEEDLLTITRYILNNPVRRGLVADPDDWPWSGLPSPLPR